MFNIAMACDQLKMTVLENGVRGRVMDFGELADCCHILDVFKIFGQQITKIKIGEKDVQYKNRKYSKLDEVLRLITTYCMKNTLKDVSLQFCYGTTIKKRVLYASLAFFRCIETFTIIETDRRGMETFNFNPVINISVNDFVERVIGNAQNIRSIEFHHLKITGRFFNAHHIRNLKRLSLIGCQISVPDAFFSFLKDNSTLKSFGWDKSTLSGMDTQTSHSSNVVYEFVAQNIPNLTALYYSPNILFINERNNYHMNIAYVHPNYELLANFNNLKFLAFPLAEINYLKLLAQKNTVETLMVITDVRNVGPYLPIDIQDSVDLNFVKDYSNLKFIRFYTLFDTVLTKNFVLKLFSKLTHLIECSLGFWRIDVDAADAIEKVVDSARNLSTLYLLSLFQEFPISLYSKLLEIRLLHGLSKYPLTIYIKMKSVSKFVSNLGENYRPDIIAIRSAN